MVMMKSLKSSRLGFFALLSLFSCLLVWIRFFSDVLGASYLFIMFNLFLAWVPYLLSLLFKQIKSFNVAFFGLFVIWIFFLPNAFYILTDLFHLFPKPQGSVWFDLIMILSFGINGLLLGFDSIKKMEQFILRFYSKQLANVSVFILMYLSSIGVYLGRFKRLNSWDILTNYSYFQKEGLFFFENPFDDIDFYGTTFVFAVFCTILYFGLYPSNEKA